MDIVIQAEQNNWKKSLLLALTLHGARIMQG